MSFRFEEKDLNALKTYKYACTQPTPLDKIINPYWEACTKLLPFWMAPNLVTFIGFLFIISGFIITGFFDLTLKKELPPWIMILNGINVFIYQTFDNMDGKQARRNKSSSVLGQLFDHGVDSFLIPLLVAITIQASAMGSSIQGLIIYILGTYYFFVAGWEEYNIKKFPNCSGNVGSTECMLLMQLH